MKNRLIALIEQAQIDAVKSYTVTDDKKETKTIQRDIAAFEIGDTVEVHQRILEGSKERIQVFSGVVISRKGAGMNAMFTVRRIVQGEGVERVFPVNSPKIAKIEVKRTGRVRRSKLYYLRDRVGKATRLRERKSKTGVEAPSEKDGKAAPAPSEQKT